MFSTHTVALLLAGTTFVSILAANAFARPLPEPEPIEDQRTISLDAGNGSPGQRVTVALVQGPAFQANATVRFVTPGGTYGAPTGTQYQNGSRLTFLVPGAGCGEYHVSVSEVLRRGQFEIHITSNTVAFRVDRNCQPIPRLTAVSPNPVDVATGRYTTIRINGENFLSTTPVEIRHQESGRRLPDRYRIQDPRTITFEISMTEDCGLYTVTANRHPAVFPPSNVVAFQFCPSNAINVLTYNIAMLPDNIGPVPVCPLLKGEEARRLCYSKGPRARAIGTTPQLMGHDVIVFQELFTDDQFDTISELLGMPPFKYKHSVRIRGGDIKHINGGIAVFSKWPIENLRKISLLGIEVVYPEQQLFGDACNGGVFGDANDCVAHKGVVYIRIRKNGQPYHIFGTHLDAGSSFDDLLARQQQIKIIRAFINKFKDTSEPGGTTPAIRAGDPVIIAGDFNLSAPSEHRAGVLGANPSPREGCSDKTTPGGDVFDFVLYEAGLKTLYSVNEVRCPKYIEGRERRDLSDHYAVLGSFVFPSLRFQGPDQSNYSAPIVPVRPASPRLGR